MEASIKKTNTLQCGVYSITNPIGDVYIGCSKDLSTRKSMYRRKLCKGQKKLYSSINTYGWEAHIFDIIKPLSLESTKHERIFWETWYWMAAVSTGKVILNMCNPMRGGADGMKLTPEQIAIRTGTNSPVYGRKFVRTKEHRDAVSGENNARSKKVINTISGEVFSCAKEAATSFGMGRHAFCARLRGVRYNNTPFKYAD